MSHNIGVIGGDGIGPEVIAEALKVVRATGVAIDTVDYDLGGARYLRRDRRGRFTSDQTDAGRSLVADRQREAVHDAPKGMKDRGD